MDSKLDVSHTGIRPDLAEHPAHLEIYELMAGPAYFDTKHPEHALVVAKVRDAMENGVEDRPADDPAKVDIQKLMRDPAYFNERHPMHDVVVMKAQRAMKAQWGK